MQTVLLALNASFVHTSLSARYLYGVCRTADVSMTVIESNINEGAELIAAKVAATKPELLLCSVYIWNRRLMEDVCARLRLMFPSLCIAWGGPECFDWENILGSGDVDYVAVGEGENVVIDLIAAVEGQRRPHHPAITWQGGPFPATDCIDDLSLLPNPYMAEDLSPHRIYYFETSRGCPFGCAYCLSSRERGVRFMSVEHALERLEVLVGKVPLIKFVDRTFNADPARARQMWRRLLDLPGDTKYHFELGAHLLREDDFALLGDERAEKFQFEIGLQSTSATVLNAISRHLESDAVLEAVRRLVALGTVEVHLDLIAGLPGESLDTFLQAIDGTLAVLPHRLHLGFLKLLPGSPLREQAVDLGLRYLRFAPYEVLRTPHMAAHDFEFLKKLARALERFYNSRQAENALRYMVKHRIMTATTLLERLSDADASPTQSAVFSAFASDVPDLELWRDLCRFDYLLQEPHRPVPPILVGNSPPEDIAVRALVYGASDCLYAALPHRHEQKPGMILRQLRWGKFSSQAHDEIGISRGEAIVFDHGLPRQTRARVL